MHKPRMPLVCFSEVTHGTCSLLLNMHCSHGIEICTRWRQASLSESVGKNGSNSIYFKISDFICNVQESKTSLTKTSLENVCILSMFLKRTSVRNPERESCRMILSVQTCYQTFDRFDAKQNYMETNCKYFSEDLRL